MNLISNESANLNSIKKACAALVLCAAIASAQTPATLLSFDGINGGGGIASLIQGTDGNLYGTSGGGNVLPGYGTVVKVTPAGTLTTLYNFCSKQVLPLEGYGVGCVDGSSPYGLVQATNGDFYGTTLLGGTNHGCANPTCGTVFKITAAGVLTTLYNFCAQPNCADGSYPNGLVQGADGNFYGTTNQSGAHNAGTVFKMTPAGTLTTLYSFCSQTNCADGGTPMGTLIKAANGNFYGTTWTGGTENSICNNDVYCGTVFMITPLGKLTTLATVEGNPSGTLVQATNGNFYGTTARAGQIFEMTPDGTVTTLATVGGYPYAGLVQAINGDLYGTTYVGGANNNYGLCQGNGCGSIFKITLAGTLTPLYSFCSQGGGSCTDGEGASTGGMMQDTNGNIYGTTIGGGANGYGTIFSLSVGSNAPVLIPPSQLTTTGSGLAYSHVTQTFNGTITIKNISGTPIYGPLQLLFTSLTTGITLANATGSFNGSSYITVPNLANLTPGQSVIVGVQFKDPANVIINFTPAVYSGSFN